MKLIIDINENEYKALINDGVQSHIALADELIRNGTPLPKGHGELVDRNILLNEAEWFGENCTYENPYPRGEEGVSVDNILKAPIIIPADKEKKE